MSSGRCLYEKNLYSSVMTFFRPLWRDGIAAETTINNAISNEAADSGRLTKTPMLPPDIINA
jgi:hypothetical protein